MTPRKRLLVVDCAALGWNLAPRVQARLKGRVFQRMSGTFPALTCPVQAAFRTGAPAARHGMVANGLYHRDLRRPMFWEQSADLVQGQRFWQGMRARGLRVGMMFWQQSLGEDVDLVLSPRPIHKHSGGMIQDCYSKPADLFDRLNARLGRSFNLMHYWGPLASRRSTDWIVDATRAVMEDPALAPDLLLTYLPHLDYDLQRHGPDHPKALAAADALGDHLAALLDAAQRTGYEVLVFGDYAIRACEGPAILPNLALRQAGLMHVRIIKNMAYPDFWYGRAFAMVDHEIAHVHTSGEAALQSAREVLEALPGVARVLDWQAQQKAGIDHPRSGDLVIVADPGRWFAYPWWTDRKEAPDFATHVDIHNKPGFDPCELFFGWPPGSVSLNTAKVRGTHGTTEPDGDVAWFCTSDFVSEPRTVSALGAFIQQWFST